MSYLRLPPKTEAFFSDTSYYAVSSTPMDIRLLVHYVYLSRMLCYNRVKVKCTGRELYPNIYAMCFAPSGKGKDVFQKTIMKKVYKDVFETQKRVAEDYRTRVEQEIENHLSKVDENGKPMFSAQQKQRYRDEHKAMDIVQKSRGGTEEGLDSLRQEMQKAGFGSTHFGNSEFIDYIATNNGSKIDFVNFIKDLYEDGDSDAKVIKSEKTIKEVTSVPCTMYIHSALDGLSDDKKTENLFQALVGRGFARRCIISVPDGVKIERKTARQLKEEESRATEAIEIYKKEINEVYQATMPQPLVDEYITISMTEEADDTHLLYIQDCKILNDQESTVKEGSEIQDRPWRALRVAACIAAFEHPESLVITQQDYETAVDHVMYYAKQFNNILYTKQILVSEKLYDFIVNKQGKGLVTKMEIYRSGLSPSGSSRQAQWLREIIPELEELCRERGKVLKEINGERNSTHFRIEDDTHDEIETKKLRKIDKFKVRLSFTKSKDDFPVQGYESYEFNFKSVGNNVRKGACYSPAFFKDGYRKTTNLDGHGNLVIIDVDDGLPIEDAKNQLESLDIAALIVTTKSHQKEKGGKPAVDRYRVFLPTKTDIAPKHGYDNMMVGLLKAIGFYDAADLAATKDQVRYYAPSPKDAEVWYSDSSRVIHWEPFDVEKPMTERFEASNHVPTGKLPRNARPNATFTDKSGKTYSWDDFRNLSESETKPVRCIFPENHANGDKHPSAFVGRHHEGTLMFKCSACQSLIFEK